MTVRPIRNKRAIMNHLPYRMRWWLRALRRIPEVFWDIFYDTKRYLKCSSIISFENDKSKLIAIITKTYHNIEKGLSLPSPRPQFGRSNLENLIGLIDYYQQMFGSEPALDIPINVIQSYIDFNWTHGIEDRELVATVERLLSQNQNINPRNEHGGTLFRSANEIRRATSTVTEDFFLLRHSVRQFSSRPIESTEIELATRIAQKSPVVCNRQSGKIRAIRNKELIRSTLEIQGGARGFIDDVNTLFCISVDLSNFSGSCERYQAWIDGGMFAMNFILGLHSQGIGTCCLNWSKGRYQDTLMRFHINIPANEIIVMFIAAGHLRDNFVVAESVRKPIDQVLQYF